MTSMEFGLVENLPALDRANVLLGLGNCGSILEDLHASSKVLEGKVSQPKALENRLMDLGVLDNQNEDEGEIMLLAMILLQLHGVKLPLDTPTQTSETAAQKKKRQRTSPEQLAILEQIFQTDKMPNQQTRVQLADQLGMSSRRVQIWFQNKRAKVKRGSSKEGSSSPDPSQDSLSPMEGSPTSMPTSPQTPAPSSAPNTPQEPTRRVLSLSTGSLPSSSPAMASPVPASPSSPLGSTALVPQLPVKTIKPQPQQPQTQPQSQPTTHQQPQAAIQLLPQQPLSSQITSQTKSMNSPKPQLSTQSPTFTPSQLQFTLSPFEPQPLLLPNEYNSLRLQSMLKN